MFGYPPFTFYNGRGAFEALGGGMPMEPGDIAFKSNFSTIIDGVVKYRRCDRHFETEGPILCGYLDGIKIPEYPEVDVSVVYATEHRCAVRIRAPGMSDRITGTDPIHDDKVLEKSRPIDKPGPTEQVYTANVVNALSNALRNALEHHEINLDRIAHGKPPANVILLRGPGMRLNVQTFNQRHNTKAFLIAPTAIIAGLGISVGLPIIKVEGATGDTESNYDAKALAAAQNLEGDQYDMGIIHMKGIDDASHDGKPQLKMELIERADRAIHLLIEKLTDQEIRTGQRFVIGVVADHSTSSTWLDHTFEPVPACFTEVSSLAKKLGLPAKECSEPLITSDNIPRLTENEASHGSLGRFCGAKLMNLLFHYARRE
jgi:2,3-diphosphopglycerate-independent phosphoglycerate mutase